VRGQEYGLTQPLGLQHAVAEGLFHERIESAGRFIQNEQVRSCHEARDQDQLLPVALGVGPDPLGRVKVETGGQFVPVRGVDLTLDPAQEVQGLGTGQRRPQAGFPGDISQATVRLHCMALTVQSEDLGSPGARTE